MIATILIHKWATEVSEGTEFFSGEFYEGLLACMDRECTSSGYLAYRMHNQLKRLKFLSVFFVPSVARFRIALSLRAPSR